MPPDSPYFSTILKLRRHYIAEPMKAERPLSKLDNWSRAASQEGDGRIVECSIWFEKRYDRVRNKLEGYLTLLGLPCRLFSISSILRRTASLMNSERDV